VTALRAGPRLAEVAHQRGMPLVRMHMRGEPQTMQKGPFALDVMKDVTVGLRQAIAAANRSRIRKSQIVLDPGLGFGKTYEQSFQLIARLPELARMGFPLLVGPSRKSFVGRAVGNAPEDSRLMGTAAAVAASILQGAHIVRVHDVREIVQVVRVTDAVLNLGKSVGKKKK